MTYARPAGKPIGIQIRIPVRVHGRTSSQPIDRCGRLALMERHARTKIARSVDRSIWKLFQISFPIMSTQTRSSVMPRKHGIERKRPIPMLGRSPCPNRRKRSRCWPSCRWWEEFPSPNWSPLQGWGGAGVGTCAVPIWGKRRCPGNRPGGTQVWGLSLRHRRLGRTGFTRYAQ